MNNQKYCNDHHHILEKTNRQIIYQWTKALLAYIRSNLWLSLDQAAWQGHSLINIITIIIIVISFILIIMIMRIYTYVLMIKIANLNSGCVGEHADRARGACLGFYYHQ